MKWSWTWERALVRSLRRHRLGVAIALAVAAVMLFFVDWQFLVFGDGFLFATVIFLGVEADEHNEADEAEDGWL